MQDQEKNKLHDTAALRALTKEEIDAYVPESPGTHHAVDLDAHADRAGHLIKPMPPKQVIRPSFSHQQTQAHNMQFRKIAIPALFGVGLVLWAIAGLTFWMKNNLPPEATKQNPLLVNSNAFIWICMVLGFALVGGAAVFIIEIKLHGRHKTQ